MKKLVPLVMIQIILLSSCQYRMDANIFSPLKDVDNLSVESAIASGDPDILRSVYERELAVYHSLDSGYDYNAFVKTSLDLADIQAVRSNSILLLLALIAIQVTDRDIAEILNSDVVEEYLYEVTSFVAGVLEIDGAVTNTQRFIAALGIIVWWYYIFEPLGISMEDLYTEYKAGTLGTFLDGLGIDWNDFDDWGNSTDVETDMASDQVDIKALLSAVKGDRDIDQNPELLRAVENLENLYSLGD